MKLQSKGCQNFMPRPMSRREMLGRCATGFGAVALSSLLADPAYGKAKSPFAPRKPHHDAKAKSVIFLYMDGGVSQVDSFDPKPQLAKENGQPPRFQVDATVFNNNGNLLKSPWEFKQHGESGHWISSLFPYISEVADDLAFVKSMTSKFSEHTSANYFLHTGNGLQGRPSMGAWMGYGLGSENQNLPGFVVINGGLIPPGGLDCFGSGFLPSAYQGSIFLPKDQPLPNIQRREKTEQIQNNKLDLIRKFDTELNQSLGGDPEIEAAISNYETAYQMQRSVPELMDLSQESEETKELYGLNAEFNNTKTFGRQCLLARRLVERGVRFIELTCPGVGHDRWDQHSNLKKGHEDNSQAVDQGIGALLTDLKQRGLFEDTLVVWSGEFGRTPFAQGSNGRDHNPFGFSLWMAGGGIRGGLVHGSTDEIGFHAADNPHYVTDIHATIMQQLGLHPQRLHVAGHQRLERDYGNVIHEILS